MDEEIYKDNQGTDEAAAAETAAGSVKVAGPGSAEAAGNAETAGNAEDTRIRVGGGKVSGRGPKRKFSRRTTISFIAVFALIALTIWFSVRFAGRSYYLASVLIIVITMIPFFALFENRKPQPKELVTIAVMSGLAVVSRIAFIWAPNFKPIYGIVIITGVALGPEAGFLSGAISAFVSNFVFGQGAWTPWQMFTMGLAGFLGGLFYQKGWLSRKRVPLAIFGGVLYLCVIGPLLDTCALFLMTTEITKGSAAAIYLSGLPVNVMQSIATAVTLLLVSQPLLEKLDRVKKKYGVLEAE